VSGSRIEFGIRFGEDVRAQVVASHLAARCALDRQAVMRGHPARPQPARDGLGELAADAGELGLLRRVQVFDRSLERGLQGQGFVQQKVNRWRARGQIGRPTLREVRAILSKTSMEWLNEGTGSPEPSPPLGGIGREVAHPARLDDRTVTDARAILDYLLGGAGIEFDAGGDVELFLVAYRCLSDPSPANRELLDQAVGSRVASTGGKNGSETPGSQEPYRRDRGAERDRKVVPFGVRDFALTPTQIEVLRLIEDRIATLEATVEALQNAESGCPIAARIARETRQSSR
jgi:hypothetical protein